MAASTVPAVLVMIVEPLVGLLLALLLRRAARPVAAAVVAALAIVPFVRAAAVALRLDALMTFLGRWWVLAALNWLVPFLLLAAIIVMAYAHGDLMGAGTGSGFAYLWAPA